MTSRAAHQGASCNQEQSRNPSVIPEWVFLLPESAGTGRKASVAQDNVVAGIGFYSETCPTLARQVFLWCGTIHVNAMTGVLAALLGVMDRRMVWRLLG